MNYFIGIVFGFVCISIGYLLSKQKIDSLQNMLSKAYSDLSDEKTKRRTAEHTYRDLIANIEYQKDEINRAYQVFEYNQQLYMEKRSLNTQLALRDEEIRTLKSLLPEEVNIKEPTNVPL